MFKKLTLTLLGIAMLTPSAFAEMVDTTETAVVEEAIVSEDAILCGGGCYYNDGIYFNVTTTVVVEADKVYLYGDYTLDNAASKEAAVEEMAELYKDIRAQLSSYGTVTRTGVYTYSDWEYTNLYDGYLSIKVDLSNKGKVEEAENVLYKNGFSSWREVYVEDTVSGEMLAATTLKGLIADKKSVYEEILEYSLGEIGGLSIWSWADSNSYNAQNNTVNLSVWADVTYYSN